MTDAPRLRLSPNWPALRVIFSETRGDWDASTPDLDPVAAVLAVEAAGVPFEKALREAVRLLLKADGTPRELTDLAREHGRSAALSGPGLTLEERQELRTKALASCEAATERWKNPTGPQPRLTDDTAPPGAA